MFEELRIENLLDLDKTVAKSYFNGIEYPWQILPKIKDFIIELGESLPKDKFTEVKDRVWIANSAKVFDSAHIIAPCIIDEEAEVRQCAFIRGNVIIGKNTVIGNSVELKNSIIFDYAQVPHYNYIGDSVLGYKSHLGAQALTSNVKSDKTLTTIKLGSETIQTGLKKFGAIVGDFVEVGCSSVLNPATIIGRNSNVYPLSSVRGVIAPESIFKNKDNIVKKY